MPERNHVHKPSTGLKNHTVTKPEFIRCCSVPQQEEQNKTRDFFITSPQCCILSHSVGCKDPRSIPPSHLAPTFTPLQCCSQKKESSTERYIIIHIFCTIKLLQTIIQLGQIAMWLPAEMEAPFLPPLPWWKNSADCWSMFSPCSHLIIYKASLQGCCSLHCTGSSLTVRYCIFFFLHTAYVLKSTVLITCSWGNNKHCWREKNVNQGNWRQNQSESKTLFC